MRPAHTARSFDPATAARARLAHRRGRADRLADLARHLPPHDRVLVEHVLRHGLRAADVARLTRRRPDQVRRRLRVLLRRLDHPLFPFVAESAALLPRPVRVTARLVVLHGLPLRAAARHQGRSFSLHEVRQHLRLARDIARAHGRRAELPRATFVR